MTSRHQCEVTDLNPLTHFKEVSQTLCSCRYNSYQVHGFWITPLHRDKIHYKVLQDQLLEVLDNM